MNDVTCNACGWVHRAYTREQAEQEVASFNEYYATLSVAVQDSLYSGKCSTIKSYEQCMSCGGSYKNFRASIEGDCPDGCTISPIIHF